MKKKMSTAQALRLIRQHKPVTQEQWHALGFHFISLGTGVFREACRIRGTDLVVKSPLNEAGKSEEPDYSDGIQHAKSEMNRIKRMARIKVLKPHLPEVFYYDAKHGIIVMRYYAPIPNWDKVSILGKVVKALVSELAGINLGDIHDNNIRLKRKDWQVCVFTDLGY